MVEYYVAKLNIAARMYLAQMALPNERFVVVFSVGNMVLEAISQAFQDVILDGLNVLFNVVNI